MNTAGIDAATLMKLIDRIKAERETEPLASPALPQIETAPAPVSSMPMDVLNLDSANDMQSSAGMSALGRYVNVWA